MSLLSKPNETRRRVAKFAERSTFTMDVVEQWPACVDCATPIRHNVAAPPGVRAVGLFRECGCPGRTWRSVTGPWEIVSAPSGAGNEAASGGDGP